jgi:hypothetical protein
MIVIKLSRHTSLRDVPRSLENPERMKDSKVFFFREKRSKKASRLWLRVAATDEAHNPLIATLKLG